MLYSGTKVHFFSHNPHIQSEFYEIKYCARHLPNRNFICKNLFYSPHFQQGDLKLYLAHGIFSHKISLSPNIILVYAFLRSQHPDNFHPAELTLPSMDLMLSTVPTQPRITPAKAFKIVPEMPALPDNGLPELTLGYQEAFFTPGISPFEAISRNWIRLIPNWRI